MLHSLSAMDQFKLVLVIFLLSATFMVSPSSQKDSTEATECKSRIVSANLPDNVTNDGCCLGIIQCRCYEAICKREMSDCRILLLQCGSGLQSRCFKTEENFSDKCAGVNPNVAILDLMTTTSANSTTIWIAIASIITIITVIIVLLVIWLTVCHQSQPKTSSSGVSGIKAGPKQSSSKSVAWSLVRQSLISLKKTNVFLKNFTK